MAQLAAMPPGLGVSRSLESPDPTLRLGRVAEQVVAMSENGIESTAAAAIYQKLAANLEVIRERLGRPLTLAEKILYGHADDPANIALGPGQWIMLRPDRVALQDVTGQMALLQFRLAGQQRTQVPTTVHCDHLIRAQIGADEDLARSRLENDEVFTFLRSASARYGLGFWEPGSGIIHQVLLENYAVPGTMIIGTDSHTPNAGGLGALAIGVGGADAVDVMVGSPWEVQSPSVLGVRLTGQLSGWSAPKDVILKVAGILTTKGGTNRIVEYFGPGCESISATGKATITNMGAELGATTSVFPYDRRMETYLRSTERAVAAEQANANRSLVTADPETAAEPGSFYDQVIEIDLSALEPHVVGPHRPDRARPLADLASEIEEENFPTELSAVLIGSCTNSSYEDISRAAAVARQASAAGKTVATPLLVTPGSEMVRATLERDGQIEALEAIGATVLANACGPCIGQWRRADPDDPHAPPPAANSIVTSFNRNFPRRNDGNPETLNFITSPEIAVSMAIGGRLGFDPRRDKTADGFELDAPGPAPEIPARGFLQRGAGYVAPNGAGSEVNVDPDSRRLELLKPFAERTPAQFQNLAVLLKATGQCTTDHISAAGPWLRFRGHLNNISDNMFIGANNAFSPTAGTGYNPLTGETGEKLPDIARQLKAAGQGWVAIGDENYGEGSSREHAAMSPRLLGAAVVITRSFARIHETNLKKQGVLALTFKDQSSYELIRQGDSISIEGIDSLAPGSALTACLQHSDGSTDRCAVSHTLNSEQIAWLWAGSALNVIRSQAASASG